MGKALLLSFSGENMDLLLLIVVSGKCHHFWKMELVFLKESQPSQSGITQPHFWICNVHRICAECYLDNGWCGFVG